MMISDCNPSLFSSGDTTIAWVATHLRYEFLTPIMHFFSALGEVGTLLFIIALSYWLWNKRHGKFLCYGFFISILINLLLKGWFQECRPSNSFWLEQVESYSFPSGHAQLGVYLWFGLAYYLRQFWLSWCCLSIGILIAVSRIYLGVHYPQDILAGALLGLSVLAWILWIEKKQFQPLGNLPLWSQILVLLSFFISYKLIVHDPRGGEIATIGTALGFWLGCQYESKFVCFQPMRLATMLGQLLIGCAGILLFWKGADGLKHLLPDDSIVIVKYIQYFLLGLWIAFGAPALSLRLGFVKQPIANN